VNKGRLEAFSDGVLAVAITLLVLDLHLDATEGHEAVGTQLRHEWPSFAAYLVSFFFIGVIWVNHNALLALVARVDRVLTFYNLLLLMWVTTIPFTTATFAAFLREGGTDARWAVVLYGVAIEGMAIAFTLMLHRMLNHDLLAEPVAPEVGRKAVLRFGLGALAYPIATGLGLLWPTVMLLAYVALAAYYMIEHTPILPSRADAEADAEAS
jgi:TMEM175 potassium channel family protein